MDFWGLVFGALGGIFTFTFDQWIIIGFVLSCAGFLWRHQDYLRQSEEHQQRRKDEGKINAGPHARMYRFVRDAPAKYEPFNPLKLRRCIASYPERANLNSPYSMDIWSNNHVALYHIRQHLNSRNPRITCVMDKDNEATPLEVLDVRDVPSLLTHILKGRNANVLHFRTFLEIAKNVDALESMWVTAWGDTRVFLQNINLFPDSGAIVRHARDRRETKMTLARLEHLEGEVYPTEIDHDQCITCSHNRKDVLFQDCGHVVLCVDCVKKLRALRCPLCQTEVTQMPRPGIRY